MDDFTDNIGQSDQRLKVEHMQRKHEQIRRLAFDRATEIGHRNSHPAPRLAETFFGDAAYLEGTDFSFKKEHRANQRLGALRAEEIGKRRKITTSSEKFKFF